MIIQITVFGATGRTGLPLVRQALDRGHEVVAFVRSPEKLTIEDEALTAVEGDVYTGDGVADAIEESDAVISVLGPSDNSPDDLMTVAGKNIIEAMREENVSRFVTLVGGSVGDPKSQMSLVIRLQRFVLELVASETLTDQENHVASVQATDLDWTVVRAPFLTEGKGTGEYRAGDISLGFERLARSDLAQFLLDCVETEQFVQELPRIGKD